MRRPALWLRFLDHPLIGAAELFRSDSLGSDLRDGLVPVAVEIIVSAHADRKRANENGEHNESSRFPKHLHHGRCVSLTGLR